MMKWFKYQSCDLLSESMALHQKSTTTSYDTPFALRMWTGDGTTHMLAMHSGPPYDKTAASIVVIGGLIQDDGGSSDSFLAAFCS
jgi:hypothetical protein